MQSANYSLSTTFFHMFNIANSCLQVSAEAFWKLQNLANSSAAGALPRWTSLRRSPRPPSRLGRGRWPLALRVGPSTQKQKSAPVFARVFEKFIKAKLNVDEADVCGLVDFLRDPTFGYLLPTDWVGCASLNSFIRCAAFRISMDFCWIFQSSITPRQYVYLEPT